MYLVCLDFKFLGVKAFGGCRDIWGWWCWREETCQKQNKNTPNKSRVEGPDTARQSCLGKRLLLIWQLLAWEETCSFLKLSPGPHLPGKSPKVCILLQLEAARVGPGPPIQPNRTLIHPKHTKTLTGTRFCSRYWRSKRTMVEKDRQDLLLHWLEKLEQGWSRGCLPGILLGQ